MSTSTKDRSIYQIKVAIRGVSPMIWRRLLVTSDTTLGQLHEILQVVFDWYDGYLHRFRIHGSDYGPPMVEGKDEDNAKLADFRLQPGERFLYEYNFFDNWKHDIRLEKVHPHDVNTKYPICLSGKRSGPYAETRGAVHYMVWLQEHESWVFNFEVQDAISTVSTALQNFLETGERPSRNDENFMEAFEILGSRIDFDPEAFDRHEINVSLQELEDLP